MSKKKNRMKKMQKEEQGKKEKSTFNFRRMSILVAAFLFAGFVGFLLPNAFSFFSSKTAPAAQNETAGLKSEFSLPYTAHIYFFGREDCQFCKAEKKFLSGYIPAHPEVYVEYHDIVKDPAAKDLFMKLTTLNDLPHVTPLTLVGGKVLQGYESDQTTGKEIQDDISLAKSGKDVPLSAYK